MRSCESRKDSLSDSYRNYRYGYCDGKCAVVYGTVGKCAVRVVVAPDKCGNRIAGSTIYHGTLSITVAVPIVAIAV